MQKEPCRHDKITDHDRKSIVIQFNRKITIEGDNNFMSIVEPGDHRLNDISNVILKCVASELDTQKYIIFPQLRSPIGHFVGQTETLNCIMLQFSQNIQHHTSCKI